MKAPVKIEFNSFLSKINGNTGGSYGLWLYYEDEAPWFFESSSRIDWDKYQHRYESVNWIIEHYDELEQRLKEEILRAQL